MSKLYVITRDDLDLAYQGVQAGHGLAAWIYANLDHPWKNETLVYLADEDEDSLKRWMQKLDMRGFRYSIFKEPDIDNQITAIACYTDSNIFSKLPKMGETKKAA